MSNSDPAKDNPAEKDIRKVSTIEYFSVSKLV